jgi:hypothetical protein
MAKKPGSEKKDFNLNPAANQIAGHVEGGKGDGPRRSIVGGDEMSARGLPVQKKQQRKDTRKMGPELTVRIPNSVHQMVKEKAAKNNLTVGDTARFLLETGIDLLNSGKIVIQPSFRDPGRVSKKKTRRASTRNSSLSYHTYRDIPNELNSKLTQIAKKYSLPKLEIVRYFFEQSCEAIDNGSISLEVESKKPTPTLYPDRFADAE